MHFSSKSIATMAVISSYLLGASASPLNKREDTTSATSSKPTAALIATTDADGNPTTVAAALPTVLQGATTTATATGTEAKETKPATSAGTTASATSATPSSTLIPSSDFPVCTDANAKPFCLPSDDQNVYVGSTYYVTWNSDYFKDNSTITIKLNYANSSETQAWTSDMIDVAWGVTTVEMKSDWLQGSSKSNLTFYALVYEGGSSKATAYDGPNIQLSNEPPNHYKPPPHSTIPDKQSLLIGLPLGLGALVVVLVGLFIGMRKHRTIGLGNIMGRRKDYSSGKSRRQRLGLGKKKGAIRLQEREINDMPQQQIYRDNPNDLMAAPRKNFHARDVSLGSLISDSGDKPTGNAFRSEIERQKTGGRF